MSPAIAGWISANFPISALSVREVGLRDAEDRAIYLEAQRRSAVVMTKDSDFITLQAELGPPQDNLDYKRKYLKHQIKRDFDCYIFDCDRPSAFG